MTFIRVLVFREAPKIIFTGLTETIGAPRVLEKNLEDPVYFETPIDLTIIHSKTNEME